MKTGQNGFSLKPAFDTDKLCYEIFSILESNFLFGSDSKNHLQRSAAGRVRILSVDAGGATDGLLAAAAVSHLESSLQNFSGDLSARVSDFFDIGAGAGAGGALVALLFASDGSGRPLFSATEACSILFSLLRPRAPLLSRLLPFKDRSFLTKNLLGKIFGKLTLRDTVKPLLITCYDTRRRMPFIFSAAAASESLRFDFFLRDVCAATIGCAAEIKSVDGKTVVAALMGGVEAENPAAAAMTHVLDNRREFPLTTEVEDLLVVSLGNGEFSSPSSPPGFARIVGQFAADMVDQAVSTAFGEARSQNYIRIQASMAKRLEFGGDQEEVMPKVEKLLRQRSIESVLFRGRRVSERTNADKLEITATELIKESESRKRCPFPLVLFKPSPHNIDPLSLSEIPQGEKDQPLSVATGSSDTFFHE